MKEFSKIEIRILLIGFLALVNIAIINEVLNNPEPGVNQSPITQPRLIILKVDTIPAENLRFEPVMDMEIQKEYDLEYDPNDPDADSIALEYPELMEDYYD